MISREGALFFAALSFFDEIGDSSQYNPCEEQSVQRNDRQLKKKPYGKSNNQAYKDPHTNPPG